MILVFSLGSNDYTLEISTRIHLNMKEDTDLALRFSTSIRNGAEFFTDLNGFQVLVHQYLNGNQIKYEFK